MKDYPTYYKEFKEVDPNATKEEIKNSYDKECEREERERERQERERERERQHELELAKVKGSKEESQDFKRQKIETQLLKRSKCAELANNIVHWYNHLGLDKLSDTQKTFTIPFPSLMQNYPPERFRISNKNFEFNGRSIFDRLHDTIETKIQTFLNGSSSYDRVDGLLVYGNFGGGKSHLLMALASFLMGKSLHASPIHYRIAVIPSAQKFTLNSFESLSLSLLTCFSGDDTSLNRIQSSNSFDELQEFLSEYNFNDANPKIVWIVDQWNDIEKKDDAAKMKVFFGSSFVIYGASANNESRKMRDSKTLGLDFFDIWGGLSKKEYTHWQSTIPAFVKIRKDGNDNVNSELDRILDDIATLTGKVPIFLRFMEEVVSQETNMYIWKDQFQLHERVTNITNKLSQMINFSTHPQMYVPFLPLGHLPQHKVDFDHRYFYSKNGIGYCVAGFIAEAVSNNIFTHTNSKAIIESTIWIEHISRSIKEGMNATVIGFMVEKSVIMAIASNKWEPETRLLYSDNNIQQVFKGFNISEFKSVKKLSFLYPLSIKDDHGKNLYIPGRCNEKSIDALYTFCQGKGSPLYVFAIQITLQKVNKSKIEKTERFMRTSALKEWLQIETKEIVDHSKYRFGVIYFCRESDVEDLQLVGSRTNSDGEFIRPSYNVLYYSISNAESRLNM